MSPRLFFYFFTLQFALIPLHRDESRFGESSRGTRGVAVAAGPHCRLQLRWSVLVPRERVVVWLLAAVFQLELRAHRIAISPIPIPVCDSVEQSGASERWRRMHRVTSPPALRAGIRCIAVGG